MPLSEALLTIVEKDQKTLLRAFSDTDVISCHINGVEPLNVPEVPYFELLDDSSVHWKDLRITPEDNLMATNVLKERLKAGKIKT